METKSNYSPRSLLITGGFTAEQIFPLLSLVEGYCRQRNINTVVFDNSIPALVRATPEFQEFCNRFKVFFLHVEHVYSARRILELGRVAVTRLSEIISLTRFATRSYLLKKADWYQTQLLHAVWDQSLQSCPDGQTSIGWFRRFLSAARIVSASDRTKKIVLTHSVTAAFLGHTVYASRAILAELRQASVDIIAHGAHVYYRLEQSSDNSWTVLSETEWSKVRPLLDLGKVQNYWQKRLIGESSYEDASRAFRGAQAVPEKVAPNMVFLHVFRDSPFNAIDRSRVFADYVHWIAETLRILGQSPESWLIRLHPSAAVWGENQKKWITSLSRVVFGARAWPDNLIIEDGEYSNASLLKHARRLVTFNGTSQLEAASLGIRPVTIALGMLESFDQELVNRPANHDEYASLLLKPSTDSQFRLNETQTTWAQALLYFREEILPLQRDLGTPNRYRGESILALENLIPNGQDSWSEISTNLNHQGRALAKGVPRTTSFSWFRKWEKSFDLNR